jgi:KDO2-lipid IV(A) lauroyltransferase
VLLDLLWMERRSGEELLSLVEFEGEENYRAASARARGILYCTAHLGNWEIHAIAHAAKNETLSVVARPLDNPALDARLVALRGATGNTVIYKRRALATVLRELRAGRAVAMLLDQNVQAEDGIFVEFFGRQAATTTVAAALALKTGCALVPVWTELRRDGRYVLHYEPALEVRLDAERDAEIARLTQAIARRAEGWIRRTPEQWLWMHRRWKTQPRRSA